MKRLFTSHVQFIYEDQHGEAIVNSSVADRMEFWWNPKRPDQPTLWDSKLRLGEDFFNEIIQHPVPIDMNTLTALKRSPLGLDLYLWLVYAPLRSRVRCGSPGDRCIANSEWPPTMQATIAPFKTSAARFSGS